MAMSYEEFLKEIKDHILDYLPAEKRENATVTLKTVEKNNGVFMEGLSIHYPQINISPTVYLLPYYSAYLHNGFDLEGIMMDIARVFHSVELDHSIDIDRIFCPEYLKDHLYFTVVGQQDNIEMLKTMPHEPIHDMALIYEIDVSEIMGESASISVTNQNLNALGMELPDLQAAASQNTPILKPYSLQPMCDKIRELLINDLQVGGMTAEDGLIEAVNALMESSDIPPLYVLSNQEGIQGAAAMYYPGVMDEVAKTLGGSFYIMPSSIHEVIVLPKSAGIPFENLAELVREINGSTVISDTDVLTNNVYSYNSRTKELLPAAEAAERDLCAKDIQNAGFKPTKQLVNNLSHLTQLTGMHHTLEDISELQRNAKRMVYHQNPDANKCISKIIQECAGQELARLQQAQEATTTAAIAAIPEA